MLWECLDCSTRFAVGLERCPHCGSEEFAEHHELEAQRESDHDA